MSGLAFKGRVDSLARVLHHQSPVYTGMLRFTSGATPEDLLAALPFSPTYLVRTSILAAFLPWFRICAFRCSILSADHRLRNNSPGWLRQPMLGIYLYLNMLLVIVSMGISTVVILIQSKVNKMRVCILCQSFTYKKAFQ